VNWYVSVFGDNWKLIADILNYHPFVRGRLRNAEQIRQGYVTLNEGIARIIHTKIKIPPLKSDGQPLLYNTVAPSLLNLIHKECILHKESFKVFERCQSSLVKVKQI